MLIPYFSVEYAEPRDQYLPPFLAFSSLATDSRTPDFPTSP